MVTQTQTQTGCASRECAECEDSRRQGFVEPLPWCGARRAVVPAPEIDDERISALRAESAVAGDREQVALCDRALAGDVAARIECERVIRDAAAELAADGEVRS